MNELFPFSGSLHEAWEDAPKYETIITESTRFFYEELKPSTTALEGDLIVCQNEIGNYSVQGNVESQFCWDVQGGQAVSKNRP